MVNSAAVATCIIVSDFCACMSQLPFILILWCEKDSTDRTEKKNQKNPLFPIVFA